MTKLQNMKIRINNPEHSKQVQECLFKLGYYWVSGWQITLHEDSNALYCWDDGSITYGGWDDNDDFVEVLLSDLQGTDIVTSEPVVFQCDYLKVPYKQKQVTFSELQELVATTNIELTFQTNGKVHIYDNDTDTGKEFDNVESAVLLLKAKAEYLKGWSKQ